MGQGVWSLVQDNSVCHTMFANLEKRDEWSSESPISRFHNQLEAAQTVCKAGLHREGWQLVDRGKEGERRGETFGNTSLILVGVNSNCS